MVDVMDGDYLKKEFKKAFSYVDDLINGKTTLLGAVEHAPDPKELETVFKKASNALQVEDFSAAEELFASLVMLNGKDVRAILGLGAALEGQGKYEFAMPIYFLVLSTTPYDPVAPFRAGICLMNLGKNEDAKKMFTLAFQCKDEVTDGPKRIYVDRAAGMLQAMGENI